MTHSYCQTLCGKICNWWFDAPPSEFLEPTNMVLCAACLKRHKSHPEIEIEAACFTISEKVHAYQVLEVEG